MNTGKKCVNHLKGQSFETKGHQEQCRAALVGCHRTPHLDTPPTHVAFFTISNRNKRNKLHNLFVFLR